MKSNTPNGMILSKRFIPQRKANKIMVDMVKYGMLDKELQELDIKNSYFKKARKIWERYGIVDMEIM